MEAKKINEDYWVWLSKADNDLARLEMSRLETILLVNNQLTYKRFALKCAKIVNNQYGISLIESSKGDINFTINYWWISHLKSKGHFESRYNDTDKLIIYNHQRD